MIITDIWNILKEQVFLTFCVKFLSVCQGQIFFAQIYIFQVLGLLKDLIENLNRKSKHIVQRNMNMDMLRRISLQ